MHKWYTEARTGEGVLVEELPKKQKIKADKESGMFLGKPLFHVTLADIFHLEAFNSKGTHKIDQRNFPYVKLVPLWEQQVPAIWEVGS